MWLTDSRVDGEVGWWAWIRLNIHTPFFRIQSIRFQCAFLAQQFDFIDEFVATIVSAKRTANVISCISEKVNVRNQIFCLPFAWITFRVLVVQTWTQTLQHWTRCKIFTGDHLQSTTLTSLFFANQLSQFGITFPHVVVQNFRWSRHFSLRIKIECIH